MARKANGAKTPATHLGADTLTHGDQAEAAVERKPIETVAQLGKAFAAWLKENPPGRKAPRLRISPNDADWAAQPIGLWNSWHRDEATGWNFNVFEGRLVEAVSDKAMEAGAR